MKVILEHNWFAPNGQRFRRAQDKKQTVFIPDEFYHVLPKSATVVEPPVNLPKEDVELPVPEVEENPLHKADMARQAGEALKAVAEAQEEKEEPVKRGRGRPRKS